MNNEHPAIPVLNLSGTPDQIGAAHGEDQRDRIQECLDQYLGFVCTNAALAVNEQTLWEKWSPQVGFNEQVAPDLVAEMRGIARGANVSFERIFMLNSMLDILSFRYLKLAHNFGCTTFAVADEPGQAAIVGQTYDMPKLLQNFLLMLRIKPERGPRQLVFTFAGIVGASGQNEAGIGLCINYLSPLDVGIGRLHSVVVRQILAAENLAEALLPPVMPPRAGGAHYLVADRDSNIVSIETTGQKYETFFADDGAIGHTNHYLGTTTKDTELVRASSIGSSLARYTALRRYFRENGSDVNLASLMELTRNHTAYPSSICAHGLDSDPENYRTCTTSAMIHVLSDEVTHITNGCACENDYHPVKL